MRLSLSSPEHPALARLATQVRGGTPLSDVASLPAPPTWAPRWPSAFRTQVNPLALSPRGMLALHGSGSLGSRGPGAAEPQTPRRQTLMALAACASGATEDNCRVALEKVSRSLAPNASAIAAPVSAPTTTAETAQAAQLAIIESTDAAAPEPAQPSESAAEAQAHLFRAAAARSAADEAEGAGASVAAEVLATPAGSEQPLGAAAAPSELPSDSPQADETAEAASVELQMAPEAVTAILPAEMASGHVAAESVAAAAGADRERVSGALGEPAPQEETAASAAEELGAEAPVSNVSVKVPPQVAGPPAARGSDSLPAEEAPPQPQVIRDGDSAPGRGSDAQPDASAAVPTTAPPAAAPAAADVVTVAGTAASSPPVTKQPGVSTDPAEAAAFSALLREKRKAREAAWADALQQKKNVQLKAALARVAERQQALQGQQDAERMLAAAAWEATGQHGGAAGARRSSTSR